MPRISAARIRVNPNLRATKIYLITKLKQNL